MRVVACRSNPVTRTGRARSLGLFLSALVVTVLARPLACTGGKNSNGVVAQGTGGDGTAAAGGCTAEQFQCGSGECIPLSAYCDGEVWHCADHSDEDNCACGPDQFACGSGECIPLSAYCDGEVWHCADHSDEDNCASSGTGGAPATGGTGGDVTTGGTPSGGTTPTGGNTATGGTSNTGGSTPTGGSTSTGGTVVNPPREICGASDRLMVNDGTNQYIVQNNIWQGSDDTQCISVQGISFEVTRNQNSGNTSGAPTGYPSIYRGCHWGACSPSNPMPRQVSSLSSVPTEWSISTASGTWDAAYDIWFDTGPEPAEQPNGCELMIWINHSGGVQPAGGNQGSANIAGASWEVWTSSVGSANYIAYRRTSTTNSANFDLKAFFDDAVSRGQVQSAWYLISVEAGFELWNGGVGLSSNSFSVEVN
jgi:hypothetical protein